MLNYNQKMNIICRDADILTARHWNSFCGLGSTQLPKNEEEQKQIDRLKGLRTYSEVKATGTRTPYKDFIIQFNLIEEY